MITLLEAAIADLLEHRDGYHSPQALGIAAIFAAHFIFRF